MFILNALISVIVVVVLGFAYVIDKPLNPEISAWLENDNKPAISHSQNAFIHILGFYCLPGEDPISIGIERYEYFTNELKKNPDIDYKILRERDEKKYIKTEPDIFNEELISKKLIEIKAISEEEKEEINVMLEKNNLLLNRYNELQKLPKYKFLGTYGPNNIDSKLFRLLRLHKLINTQIRVDIIAGRTDQALERLLVDIQFVRRIYPDIQSMICKMVFTDFLVRDIEIINELVDYKFELSGINTKRIFDSLSEFTKEDLSIKKVLMSEFLFTKNLVETIYNEEEVSKMNILDQLKYKIFFKPNRTVNKKYNLLIKLLKEYDKNPHYFLTDDIEREEISYYSLEFLLNPIGYFIDNISSFKYISKKIASVLQSLEGYRRMIYFKLLTRINRIDKDNIEKELEKYNNSVARQFCAIKSVNLSEDKRELYIEQFPLCKGCRDRIQLVIEN